MGTPYRDAAGRKALEAGFQNAFIRQYGKKADCNAYVMNGIWATAWGDPKQIIPKKVTPVAVPPAITKALSSAAYEQSFDFMSEPPVAPAIEIIPIPDAEPTTAPDAPTMQFSTFPRIHDRCHYRQLYNHRHSSRPQRR